MRCQCLAALRSFFGARAGGRAHGSAQSGESRSRPRGWRERVRVGTVPPEGTRSGAARERWLSAPPVSAGAPPPELSCAHSCARGTRRRPSSGARGAGGSCRPRLDANLLLRLSQSRWGKRRGLVRPLIPLFLSVQRPKVRRARRQQVRSGFARARLGLSLRRDPARDPILSAESPSPDTPAAALRPTTPSVAAPRGRSSIPRSVIERGRET